MRPHLASLVEDFRAHAAETAVVAHRGNRRYPTTYGELASLAGRFSAELERRGIGPGDRVVIWGENSAEWIAVFFGCLLRGVIAVPLDAAGDARFAARVVQETAPKLIVGDSGLLASLDRADAARERVPQGLKPTHDTAAYGTAEAVPLSETGSSAIPRTAMHSVGEHLPAAALFAVDPSVNEQAPFQIVFTSGTTSEPRGIVHTHRNVLVSLAPIEREMAKYRRYERIFHPLRFLHSLPLSHVFGQFMGLWIPALLAAEVHFAAELEPSRIAALIRRERISVLIAVPRVLHLLRAHLLAQFPESSQLSVVSSQKERDGAAQDLGAGTKTTTEILRVAQNDGSGGGTREITRGMVGIVKRWWRFRRVHRALGWKFWAVISGGATLPAELETFWRRLGFALIQGYGMTETAALVTLNHPFHVKQGSIGRPLPGREVKISDDGEILVRGDMLSGATWSGGAMHPREGEWLATGDLAEKNASGELRFLGRKGDVIVTGAGLNIHPGDLESALSAQAGIRSCVVVGCEFASGTEPVAVVLTAGPDANLQAAVDAANRTLAGYQQIRRVLRWPELQFPYTSTGKLIRRQVAAWACATLASRHSGAGAKGQDKYGDSGLSGQNDDGRRDSLLSLIAEVTGEPIPATDGPNRLRLSEDLHLDSLGRVQLQSALEQRFSLELEDDAIAVIQTVGDLRALIDQHLAPTTPVPTTSPSEQRSVSGELQFTESAVSGQRSAISQQQPAAVALPTTENRELTTHTYPHWPWTWPIQALRVLWIELVMRPLVWFLAAPRVTYVSNPTHDGKAVMDGPPALLISNHVTAYDGALVLYALPFKLRHRVAAAMSGEMLADMRSARNQGNFLLNLLAPGAYYLLTALFNVFPLPRARGFRRSFAHAGEAMDHGYSVLIFPEGTRSRDGKLHAFRPGIGLLAQQSRAPILPIAIRGLYELTTTHTRWFRSGRIEVRAGALIPAADETTDPAALSATLEQAVRALL